MQRFLKYLAALVLAAAYLVPASAALITSFESGLTGITIDPGTLTTRVAVQSSFVSDGNVVSPTHGSFLLKLSAGITPLLPGSTDLTSIATLDNNVNIINSERFFAIDVNLANRTVPGDNDKLGIGIGDTAYWLLETDNFPPETVSGWHTLIVEFLDPGSFSLSFLCANDTVSAAGSFCGFDYVRTASSLEEIGTQFPIIGIEPISLGGDQGGPGDGDPGNGGGPGDGSGNSVPEPGTFALAAIGLGLIGRLKSRRNKPRAKQ